MDSEANIKGLTKLQELANEGLITFDASINGGEGNRPVRQRHLSDGFLLERRSGRQQQG